MGFCCGYYQRVSKSFGAMSFVMNILSGRRGRGDGGRAKGEIRDVIKGHSTSASSTTIL